MALSTQSTYSAGDQDLLTETGPLHRVQLTQALNGDPGNLPAGTVAAGREQTLYGFDEGQPDGSAAADLQTSKTTLLLVDGYAAQQQARTATSYDWTNGNPTSTMIDPGGLAGLTMEVGDGGHG